MKVAQLCPTLCDPMDYTVHGIVQARILEWVAVPFSRGSSQPGIEPRSPALQVDSLPAGGSPDSSVGKESSCNAGDPSSTPGSGRSPGERIGYPLQYSWASLVAQLVKNLPAMRETRV